MKVLKFFYFALLSVSCCNYPEKTDFIEVNGQKLLYAVRGPKDGRPVVLVHGNGGSHKSLLTQAKQLARWGYRVYSPDSRGQGANPPVEELHYTDMTEDTFQFIRKMGLEKPYFYGWSDGGIIGLMLEAYHPGTLGKLAVSGANISPDCGDSFEEFREWILANQSPVTMMMLSEPNIDPADLAAIKCPTLVTVGSKDVISVGHTELIARSIPGAELVVVKGGTHSSYIKRSPKMGRMLKKFYE
ncbi:MAG: alpha/beta hydrolase [Bacteroidales bacterium]|nr:alpha/beta hydrolase [Bacteroidales bacterium]